MLATMRRLILASTSPYRRELMNRLGLAFEAIAPDGVDEESLNVPPRELVQTLARMKAESIAATHPDAVIIGSDQVGCLDGHVLTKPGTVEAAESQLAGMAGHTHELLTGVCVLDTKTGSIQEHIDIHRLTMRALSPEEIRKYVATEYPLDCAGSYKIEGLGISLFEQIQGHDFTAITGLPLMAVCQMLAQSGIHPLRGTK